MRHLALILATILVFSTAAPFIASAPAQIPQKIVVVPPRPHRHWYRNRFGYPYYPYGYGYRYGYARPMFYGAGFGYGGGPIWDARMFGFNTGGF